MFEVFGFYKFIKISYLKKTQKILLKTLSKKNIRGTIIISKEGLNGTISGKNADINFVTNKLKKILKGGVVGTLMSNYGLEKFLKKEKIKFVRANVGDRYVKELMKKNGINLGGEQSGHIILGKFATTGDGLLVALESLFSLRKGKKASNLFKVYKSVPQKLLNLHVKDKDIINKKECKLAIKIAKNILKRQGRLLVRKSGTEPKIRIMAESYDKNLILKCIKIVKKSIK